MQIVNLTPHDVHIFNQEGTEIIRTYPVTKDSEGKVIQARVDEKSTIVEDTDGIPTVDKTYTHPINLPEPQEGTVYIVSAIVLSALKGRRTDLVCPDTGPNSVVRNDKTILGVRGFQI